MMEGMLVTARRALERFWFHSVRRQLVLGVALVHAVLMSVFIFDLTARQHAFLHHESMARAEGLAQTLALNSLSWVLAGDLVGLSENIEALERFPSLAYAMILDPSGRVLAHTDPALVGKFVSDEQSLLLLDRQEPTRLANNERIVDVAAPVRLDMAVVGWARVALSQKGQQAELLRVQYNGLIYTLLAIALGTILAMLIAKRLTSGLRDVVHVSEQVRQGRRDVRAACDRTDEIGTLARNFNTMIEAVAGSEKAMADSLEWRRTILDTSAAGILVVDGDGIITEANATFSEMFGFKPGEALLMPLSALFPSTREYEDVAAHITRSLLTGTTEDMELPLHGKDGNVIWCRLAGRAVDPQRPESGMIWLVVDISIRKRAETALRMSEERFRTIADFTFDWEYWQGPDGQLLWVSPSCQRMTGYTSADFLTDSGLFLRIVHPEDLPAVNAHMAETVSGKQLGPCDFDYRIISRHGEVLWFNHCCRPIKDSFGNAIGRRGCMRDVSRNKRAEAELIAAKEHAEAANAAKDHFLATMSHEIRTPLNGVMGMLQLLLGAPLPDEQREQVAIALDSSRGLLTILSDILDITRLQSGRLRLVLAPTWPQQVLHAVGELFRNQLEGKRLSFTINVDPSTPRCVLCDEGRLRQILFNLVGNAVKFTDKGGVTLSVCALPLSPGPGKVRLLFTVADTGIGIAPGKTDFVFESFSQEDSRSFSRRFGGLGLGLSIVRGFVQLLGGTVAVESEPGEGTTFHFTIVTELCDASHCAHAQRAEAPTATSGPATPMNVLVAEDDRINQLTVRRMVEKLGHRVSLAANGAEALARASTEDFDIILMDIQMPGMDGVQATRAIRALPAPRGAVPIVAVTAHAMRGDEELFLNAGMTAYISKPIDKDALAEMLSRFAPGLKPASGPGREDA